MSTEVTPESLRAHAKWVHGDALTRDNTWADLEAMNLLLAKADRLESEQRPLPTEPGWYACIVVERGGESCTGALLTDGEYWETRQRVGGRRTHNSCERGTTIRWAEQDGTTPGQTLWEAPTIWGITPGWDRAGSALRERWEQRANAVLAAHGTPTLTPVGENPEVGKGGLLPVVLNYAGVWWSSVPPRRVVCAPESEMGRTILADPRPDGAA